MCPIAAAAGVPVLPASVAPISMKLVPLFSVAVATLAGERLGVVQWIGAITTIAAVLTVGALEARRAPAG